MSAISSPAAPRDRRPLWPFLAVGAAVAAIALPLAFLHGKHPAPAPAPAPANAAPATAAPTTPATGTAAPSVHAARPSVHAHAAAARPGPLSDPFARHITAPSSGSTSSSSTTSPASHATPVAPTTTTTPNTAAPTTTPSTGAPTTTAPSVNASPVPTVTPAAHPWHVYRAYLRVTSTGVGKVHRRIAHLQPLPTAHTPFVVYLGAVDGGHRVAFLLNRLAVASGAGRCARFDGPYEALYLKPGQIERVTIPFAGTGMTYRVGVSRLKGYTASSAHAASVANRRTSKAGHTLLRRFGLLGSVHFSTTHGVVPAPKRTHACG